MNRINTNLPGKTFSPPAVLERNTTSGFRRPVAERAGAALFIGVPTLFTGAFIGLSLRFNYPGILRQPAADVLTRFHQKQGDLLPLWWALFGAALLFIPAAYYGGRAVGLRGGRLTAATVIGTVAGMVQAIGLARWIFLVPLLAARFADPQATDVTRETARLLFESFHQFVGMGIGEWLGYLFTGLWTLLIASHQWANSGAKPAGRLWGMTGMLSSLGILAGLLEPFGVEWAGAVNALAYTAWSAWLLALGLSLLLTRRLPTRR